MIRYTLKCNRDHGFESWFASSAAYETLSAAGHLSCPECGSAKVAKALMAPQVRTETTGAPTPVPPAGDAAAGDRSALLRRLKARIEANSDYVGPSFAAEARRMHAGEAPARAIHGEARLDEARALIEDGVPVAPLPFIPSRRSN